MQLSFFALGLSLLICSSCLVRAAWAAELCDDWQDFSLGYKAITIHQSCQSLGAGMVALDSTWHSSLTPAQAMKEISLLSIGLLPRFIAVVQAEKTAQSLATCRSAPSVTSTQSFLGPQTPKAQAVHS
jgi:hypothetical protein